MTVSRVIKLSRDDSTSEYVLIQVTQVGSHPLDLKIVGTEGESPYATTLKHARVSSLRVKNCPASESEWEVILQSLFQQTPIEDIHATASVQSETSLSITIRKEVQGITQRLGSIVLKHEEDEAIELFQWCAASADAVTKSNEAMAEAAARAEELDTAVKELKKQLDEIVDAKLDDETALLQKFRDLLNEKKEKIREQQRIISSGSFQAGQQSLSEQPQLAEATASRQPVASRPGKRKIPAAKAESEAGDEEGMEVDRIKSEPEDTDPGVMTEATQSEASDVEVDDIKDGTEVGPARSTDSATVAQPISNKKTATQPPPPRSLPFGRKKADPKPTPAAGNETESDDEL